MKSVRWVVDGPKLTARRLARGLTAAELARRAGISSRTLARYEKSGIGGARALGEVEHLKYAARVLHVSVEAFAHPETAPADAPAPAVASLPAATATSADSGAYAPPAERARLLATTQLENIVALEARLPPPKPVMHEKEPIPVLTARKLQNVFSAFAAYDGERFAVIGHIAKQRGASPLEAAMIKTRHGLAVRFLLVRTIGAEADIKVTVHTAKAHETRQMQRVFEEEREVCVIARVRLATPEAVKDDKGFDFFLSPKPLPWGFVVEAVI
jgi:transcriptional regulator with XRE-family HTH domain